MSGGKRVWEMLLGLLTLVLCLIMIVEPESGFKIVALILSTSLIVYGVREIVYYITMARHMVGGKSALYLGVIVLDIGAFAYTLVDVPSIYIVLYLLGVHAFSGAVDIMRSMEAKRLDAPSWRFSMFSGAVNIAVAVLCVVFLKSPDMIVYIYTAGLAYSALARMVSALRRTAVVYIQ